MFDGVRFQYSLVLVGFLFTKRSDFVLILFLSSYALFRFSLWAWHIFLWQIPSQCLHFISSLIILGFLILSCRKVWCHPCRFVGYFFFFFCVLWTLYPPVHFLNMCNIIPVTNSNVDNASPWNITHWIFTSFKLFPPAVSSTLHFSMIFSINFMTSPDISYILTESIFQFCRTLSYAFL